MATTHVNAAASGTFTLGGDLQIHRLGFGAMRITGEGIWGEPKDPEKAKQVLRRVLESSHSLDASVSSPLKNSFRGRV
jgi:pyridoxine 4-dehydrogenase